MLGTRPESTIGRGLLRWHGLEIGRGIFARRLSVVLILTVVLVRIITNSATAVRVVSRSPSTIGLVLNRSAMNGQISF